ncbi:MAG: TraC family protein [Patescibacteria group bacterium]
MAKKPTTPKRPSTQKYLDIAEIRDDLVVLKDGTVRAVVLVSSINFALKSADEQEALIQSYIQFLNGLDYPLQVVIQSRRMQIDEYIVRMNAAVLELKNELLRAQAEDYVAFIKDLVQGNDIMSKRFYVVIPYDPMSNKKKNFWTRLQETLTPGSRIRLSEKQFAARLHELDQRVAQALGSLNSMGISGVRLDTQGLIELYYNSYNPMLANIQPLNDVGRLDMETSYGF